MINLKKIISLNLVVSMVYMVFPMNVLSATIENIAELKYKSNNNPFKTSSNQVISQVGVVQSLDVDLNPSFNYVDGFAKQTWLFPARVINRGTTADTYKMTLANLPAGVTGEFYRDVNGNGKLDPEDGLITDTDSIDPGGSIPIIISIKDNDGLPVGTVMNFDAVATSNIDTNVLSSKMLTVRIKNPSSGGGSGSNNPSPSPQPSSTPRPISFSAELKKTVFPTGRAKAGDILTYYIEFTNKNNYVAKDVVVEDRLPSGLIAIADSASTTGSAAGKVTFSSDGKTFSETKLEGAKFLKFSWSSVEPSEVVTAYFKAKISDVMDNGNLENIATASYKAANPNGSTPTSEQNVQTSNVMSNMAVNTIKNEYIINGTVYDKKTGLPKEGTIVTVYDKDGKVVGKDITGKLGKYNVPVDSKGEYKIVYSDSNGTIISEKTSEVTKPGTNPAPIEIRGKVMESQTKQVIANAELKLLDENKKEIITIRTNDDGIFVFEKDKEGKNLKAGKYLIRVVNAKGEVSYARVNVTVSEGDMIVNLEILIDPFGSVYDELGGTDVRIKGAQVKLISNCDDPNSVVKLDDIEQGLSQKNPYITDDRGVYQYFLNNDQLNNKNYCLSVNADGYKDRKFFLRTGPNKDETGKYMLEITDTQDAKNKTIVRNIETIPYNIGLTPTKTFDINKASNKSTIEIGEVVTYTVDATNKLKFKIDGAKITDHLPFGFKYVPESLRLNGNAVKNFDAIDEMDVTVGEMTPNQKVIIMYQARTGIRVPEGPAINKAQISGYTPKKELLKSDIAKATVFVKKGVFSKNGAIIGRVYIDENKNGMQDSNEPGVEGISLYTAGGIRVITDSKGKYSIPDIQDGDFALVLDLKSLPKGLVFSTESQWIGQDDRSQRVFVPESGLAKANFRLVREDLPKIVEVPKEEPKENPLKAVYSYPDKFSIKRIPYITYPDIKEHPAQGVIEYESGLDIIHGYPDGEFKPGRSISRAETTKLTLVALKSFDIKIGTTLSYILKNDAKVTVRVLNSKGEIVKTFLTDIDKKSGINNIYWDGKDDKDNLVTEGNYNFEVKAEDKNKITNTLNTIVQAIPAIPNYKPEGQANFKDVPATHWATNFIKAGNEEKIVTGYPDDTFRPDNFIPRFEMAVIAVKSLNLNLDTAKDELPFEDANEIPVWARKYVYLAYTNGLLPEFPDNKFYPARNISRAEIAMFVNALINKQKIDAQVSGKVEELSNEILIDGVKVDLSNDKTFTRKINKDYSEEIKVSLPGLNLKSEFDEKYQKRDIKR